MSQFPEEPLYSVGDSPRYFPAFPGQLLKQGQYKIVRKLGWGKRSSVWLAVDLQEDPTFYCVIKILTSLATLEHNTGRSQELASLESIQEIAAINNLPALCDHFTQSTQNGEHLCIVTVNVLADINKFRLSAPTGSLRVHIVKKVIASIVQTLYTLHKNYIIHGAVTPENFAFLILSRAEDLDPVHSNLSPPKVEYSTVDGVKYPIVYSQPIPHDESWEDDRVFVADWDIHLNNLGHAQAERKDASWEKTGQDRSLRPPEAILQTSFNSKSDIWMLGCATYLLLTGENLFVSENLDDATHLARISALTGVSFDSDTWKKSKQFDEYFLPSGELKVTDRASSNLEKKLRSTARLSDKDVKPASAFIQDCLTLDPADRPSANNLLCHSWLASGYGCSCGYCMSDSGSD